MENFIGVSRIPSCEDINGTQPEAVNFPVEYFLKVTYHKALPLVYCVQVGGSWNTKTTCAWAGK